MNWLVPHTNQSVALIFLKNTKLWSGLWTPIQIIDQSQMPKNALFVKKFKTPISNFMLEISIYEPNIAIDEAIFDSLSPILEPMDK